MTTQTYRRVYIEVVTREDLASTLSIENLMFQLCERLHSHTAIVQLNVVDSSDSLAHIAVGNDLIPAGSRSEVVRMSGLDNIGHAACLYFACTALDTSAKLPPLR